MHNRVLILGGFGFVGMSLIKPLIKNGYDIVIATRKYKALDLPVTIKIWDGLSLNEDIIKDCFAIINLCGENIFKKCLTKKVIHELSDSRILPTKAIADYLNNHSHNIKVVINASAIGYYSDNFLAQICKSWENEAEKINNNIRLVITRFAVILGDNGGMWPMLKKLYHYGLGVHLGSGKQIFYWVHIEDVINFILFALKHDIKGKFDLLSPGYLSYKELHHHLTKSTISCSYLSIPNFILYMLLGKRASILLDNYHIEPKNITGFNYKYQNITQLINNRV